MKIQLGHMQSEMHSFFWPKPPRREIRFKRKVRNYLAVVRVAMVFSNESCQWKIR